MEVLKYSILVYETITKVYYYDKVCVYGVVFVSIPGYTWGSVLALLKAWYSP